MRGAGVEHPKTQMTMHNLQNKHVLVVGLGSSGQAASRLLRHRQAHVTAIDNAESDSLKNLARELQQMGVSVELGAAALPAKHFDFVVVSPGVPNDSKFLREAAERGLPIIGELELGFQQSLCLNIAVTGTNGKTTTTELIERMLRHANRKTIAAGNIGLPLCAVADQTKELEYVTLEVSSFQLETIQFFRSAIAVLLNITPDHLDRYGSMAEYTRAKARIFQNQQAFDWAIIQSEALAQMRALGLSVPSKVITFSANNRRADLFLERGLIMSRLPGWKGRLMDTGECQLRGPHNAENLMAALAVGRVLRLPLDVTVEALKMYPPAPHRCERVAEMDGVLFVNDSKATNVDAVAKALEAMPRGRRGEPNVLLIAGGKDKGLEFHDIGPLLARRVKKAFLIGEMREKIRAAWSLFTPCVLVESLLEAVAAASEHAVAGDVVLLSPACSSFDMFRNYQHRGDVFRDAVCRLNRSVVDRAHGSTPFAENNAKRLIQSDVPASILPRSFLRENPAANNPEP